MLEKAMEFTADNVEILDCLAECYSALGRSDRVQTLEERLAVLRGTAVIHAVEQGA